MKSTEGKYGVIICPDCKKSKVIDFRNKTTVCSQCGKKLILKKMKIQYRTNSREEASWVIGQLNAQMEGEELPKKKQDEKLKDPFAKAAKKSEIASDEKERLELVCTALDDNMDGFKIEDIEKVYRLMGKKTPKNLKNKLKHLENIYEPEKGVYRAV